MAAQQISEFPVFGSLPEQIRKDIWERAVKKVLNEPSIQFLNLTRGDVDSTEEDRLAHEAVQRAVADASADWDQLTPNEQLYIQQQAEQAAIRKYRASLVNLAPTQDRTGLAEYSARWQLNELAVTCTEAVNSTRRVLDAVQGNGSALAVGDSGHNAAAPFQPSNNIVCLAGPENDARAGMPFFANESLFNPHRQVVFVTSSEFRQNPLHVGDFVLERRNNTTRCAPLIECCPELRGVQKIAFIYHEQDDPILYRYPFLVGLAPLWPHNFPGLRELYLIDESISLRDGIQAPPPPTPRFEGCGATFYEVTPDDMDLWDIPKAADSPFAAVFQDADDLQQEYAGWAYVTPGAAVAVPAVKVLACVPDKRSQ
ncbi:hypothetical protein C8A01DRAFT_40777 [Parachaetomium inaequale]|uniref:Uncharacterized protein n=1 Tax=Parachaetomium inaequale TaxID=2588326 RepID=A0AAN6P6R1_9PEZI|nr:hypothetical protein C8A01DRAFT_40777 [Parachaetomium inaequale]